jgi:hypothetical protein
MHINRRLVRQGFLSGIAFPAFRSVTIEEGFLGEDKKIKAIGDSDVMLGFLNDFTIFLDLLEAVVNSRNHRSNKTLNMLDIFQDLLKFCKSFWLTIFFAIAI